MMRCKKKGAGKRKTQEKAPQKGALVAITGARMAEVLETAPLQLRVVDSLGMMLRNGSINAAMHDAGRAFSCDFEHAHLNGQTALCVDGMPDTPCSYPDATTRAAMARMRVHRVLIAVGGMHSVGASLLWDICGLGMSLSQWAANRNINGSVAKGMLVAVLDIVARVYGYV